MRREGEGWSYIGVVYPGRPRGGATGPPVARGGGDRPPCRARGLGPVVARGGPCPLPWQERGVSDWIQDIGLIFLKSFHSPSSLVDCPVLRLLNQRLAEILNWLIPIGYKISYPFMSCRFFFLVTSGSCYLLIVSLVLLCYYFLQLDLLFTSIVPVYCYGY